ncbi:hypothetical protein HUS23_13710 [Ectothiorhodospiraceae bacterium 2226]|nr:hypothetical protein HUS23_13710 [Ectothiorhodospiraceae bacterium 2226]
MDNSWSNMRRRPQEDRRYTDDDEISLVDLWLVLARRKWWIIGTFLVVLAVAAAAAFLSVHRYEFITTIEIGTRISGNQVSPIESPEAVVAKLNEGYIPPIIEDFAAKTPDGVPGNGVRARVPQGSNLVVLQSEGPQDRRELFTDMHNLVVQRLQQDHNRMVDVIRQGQQVQLAEEMSRLAELESEATVMEGRLERVQEARRLLIEEIKVVRALVERAEGERERAVREAGETTAAMTLLLLTNDLHQNRARLTQLEERAAVQLVNERDLYASELGRVRGSIESQKQRIEGVKIQLANIQETRLLSGPRQSLNPTAPNRKLMVALGAVLGLVAGVFLAFFAELGASVRARREAVAEAESEHPRQAA